jgi:hypothetical protein
LFHHLVSLGGSVVKKLFVSLAAVAALCVWALAPVAAWADSVAYAELEAIGSDGSSAYTDDGSARTITGVVICNPSDMLDSTAYSSWVGYQWQTFIQSLNSSDFGGVALYACSDGSKMGGNTLTTDVWNSLLSSLSGLSYGDEVQVTFYGTSAYKGKVNITSEHNTTTQFSVSVLNHNVAPTATAITLADLKDSSDSFIFDSTRATGCERYQGTLVHLDGLTVADPSDWKSGGEVTVRQGDLTFTLDLGLDSSLFTTDIKNAISSSTISISAILDQEDGTYVGDSGYSLWLTSASLLSVPEPGSSALLIAGLIGLVGYAWRKRRK